jgi:hypothetical protein
VFWTWASKSSGRPCRRRLQCCLVVTSTIWKAAGSACGCAASASEAGNSSIGAHAARGVRGQLVFGLARAGPNRPAAWTSVALHLHLGASVCRRHWPQPATESASVSRAPSQAHDLPPSKLRNRGSARLLSMQCWSPLRNTASASKDGGRGKCVHECDHYEHVLASPDAGE